MTSMAETLKKWEEERIERREELAREKHSVMTVLRDHGIKYVSISYNGYGDSGQIDEIKVYGAERTTAPDGPYDSEHAIDMPDVVVTLPEHTGQKLETLLDEYGWRLAYDTNPGFENNDGGQGTILFDVDENKITIEHGTNFTETHYSTHEIE